MIIAVTCQSEFTPLSSIKKQSLRISSIQKKKSEKKEYMYTIYRLGLRSSPREGYI